MATPEGSPLSFSEQLAQFSSSLRPENLPAAVVDTVKQHILDTIGIGLAAAQEEFASSIEQVLPYYGGDGKSTVWGKRVKSTVPTAAMANAAFSHGLDFDDTHVGSITHVSCTIIPTALTVGEMLGKSGLEVITAAVAGYEVLIRLGLAAPGKFHDRGYHPTGVTGGFGAAVTAAKLLGLTVPQTVNAMGIVGSMVGGLQQFLDDGSWIKRMHAGWAANAGITAALLAQKGFTGPRQVLEGRFGLYATHVGLENVQLDQLTAGLGHTWETLNISFKPYPVCHMNHAFMGAAIDLLKEHQVAPNEIKRLICQVHPEAAHIICEPVAIKAKPPTVYAALFSLPYSLAMVLIKGKAGPEMFTGANLGDRSILELAARVSYELDTEWSDHPRHFSGWVIIETNDGRRLEKQERHNLGSPDNPLSREAVLAKFMGNAEVAVSTGRATAIADAVDGLERLDNVSQLTELLVP